MKKLFDLISKLTKGTAVIFLCVFFLFCNRYTTVTEIDSNKDGKIDQYMISLKDKNLGIAMVVDESKEGNFDDISWIHGEPGNTKESFVVFNKIYKNGKVKSKTWYGPNTIKLIEFSDEDGDGFLETKIYYNKLALPKIINGHIARIEIDTDKDDKTDVWLFPADRVEIDSNKDGVPDRYSTDTKKVQEAYKQFTTSRKFELTTLPLEKPRSFVIHPELIQIDRWKANLNIHF
ncbi:MAG: hypothetical protein L6Q54_03645 [Leptospiraceae bacterium]|nr:hypothetical protein [Leptospiraceae bacterium]MCK6380330.1 hypothetical protein [Leptospiraceae bacterium]NUM41755.1 hypothetical protein [Leptospiraceae bacterium]